MMHILNHPSCKCRSCKPNHHAIHTGPGWLAFLRFRLGPDWVVARKTKRNLERYPNSTIITRKQYGDLCDEWNHRKIYAK